MGTIRKIGNKYRAEVCIDRRRKSKSHRTKREAQKWIRDLESGFGGFSSNVTLAELVERFIRDEVPKHKGAKQDALRLRRIVKELPNKPFDKLSISDFSEWKLNKLKTVQPPTVRRYMVALNSVLNHALTEWQVIDKNPLESVKKPPNNPPRNKYPTESDIKLILEQLETGKHKIQVGITLQIALETAMRAGEILSLNRSNIDYKRRVATLTDTKNGDNREVPLSSKAMDLLKSVDPEYFTVSSAVHSRLFHDACKAAGVDDIRFHDSRAAGLMRLSKKVDVLTLARIAGMRDTKTLMIYYRKTADEIAKELD